MTSGGSAIRRRSSTTGIPSARISCADGPSSAAYAIGAWLWSRNDLATSNRYSSEPDRRSSRQLVRSTLIDVSLSHGSCATWVTRTRLTMQPLTEDLVLREELV